MQQGKVENLNQETTKVSAPPAQQETEASFAEAEALYNEEMKKMNQNHLAYVLFLFVLFVVVCLNQITYAISETITGSL